MWGIGFFMQFFGQIAYHEEANISQMRSNSPTLGTHISGEGLKSRLSQSSTTRALPQDATWRSISRFPKSWV
jgi:hypothetical protein